jgi:hypothetical protein
MTDKGKGSSIVTKASDAPQTNADMFRLLCFDWFRKFARDAKLTPEQYGSNE